MRRGEGAVGIFDSGVGGLSVVRALLRAAPGVRVLYVADQAHVPYGGRPLSEVRAFAEAISRFLVDEGCRSVVMACNISSATALDTVRATLAPLPVFGMISGAAAACAASGSRCVAVLATEGTVRSGEYGRQIRARRPDCDVIEVPCPAFVPLVESGDTCGDAAEHAARQYLAPAARAGATTVVLGCTHYPFLIDVLRRVASDLFPRPPAFLDPADVVARDIAAALSEPPGAAPGAHLLLTTGCAAAFADQVRRFLPGERGRVSQAAWANRAGRLAVQWEECMETDAIFT